MFWDSIILMTIIDVLIIGIVGYTLWIFYCQKKQKFKKINSRGFLTLVSGLSVIALFYLFDLATMHLLPLFLPVSRATAIMVDLHLNYHWAVILFAVVVIATGVRATGRGVLESNNQLRESDEKLRLIIDNVPAGISYFDCEQRFLFANRQYENLVHLSPDKLLGMTVEEVIGPVAYKVAREYIQRVLKGETVSYENTLPAENGRVSIAVSYVPDLGPDKKIKGFIALVRDISRRKHNEEELAKASALLETTIESISQSINVYDADLKLVAFNQNFVDFNDFAPGSIRIGMAFEEVVRLRAQKGYYGPVEDIEMLVRERIADRKVATVTHHERTMPDGRIFAVQRDLMPGGGFVQTSTDITKRKLAEQESAEKSILLETTFGAVSQAINVYDAGDKLVAYNESYENMFGFPLGFLRLGISHEEVTRFRAEAGHFGNGDVEEMVKKRMERTTQRMEYSHERILPNGLVYAFQRKVMPNGGYVNTMSDITERKRAEREFQQKSALLEMTLERMSQGIMVHDADLKLIAFNHNYIDFCNYPPGFIRLGMDVSETLRFRANRGDYGAVDDIEALMRERINFHKKGGDNRHERTTADRRIIASTRDLMPDGGYVMTFTDVTKQTRADNALRKAHEVLEIRVQERTRQLHNTNKQLRAETAERIRQADRYKSLLDAAPDPTVSVNADGKIIEISAEVVRVLGYRHDELIGQDVELLVPEGIRNRHVEHRQTYAKKPTKRAMGEGLELSAQCKDGHQIPVEVSLSPARIAGEIIVIASIRNIAQRKEILTALEVAKERYRQLVESTNAIPWEADAKTGSFIYVGPQAVELIGYSRELWLEKEFWDNHIHSDDRDWVVDYCKKSAIERENYEIEYRMIAADGRVIWLQDIVNVVKEEGEPVTLRGFMIDITERKSLEELRRNVNAWMINAQEEERRKISRELHDDFGQRLALLAVGIQTLSQQMPEPKSETVKSMENLWSQTQKLSTDLHRLSRQLHPAILDQLGLGPALRSLCGEISEQHGIQIEFTEHEVPDSIARDITLCLYRTAQEGLRNIVKHSGAKDAKVELMGSQDSIHLRIIDDGVGFDPKSIKSKGLGLVSIEERSRLVRGDLSLKSAPSQGTCIDIEIPLGALQDA